MELSRNEVIALYNAMKITDLSKMSTACRKAFIVDAIKLKPTAEKVLEENTKIANATRTEEYETALKKYVNAKNLSEAVKTKETKAAFEKAIKEFEPLLADFEEKFNDAASELEQTFELDLLDIPLNDFVEYLGKLPNEYTFNNIMVFEKLLV